MSIQNRINKLEGAAGVDRGDCACAPGGTDVRYYPGEDSEKDAKADTRPVTVCDRCGLPKTRINVVYVPGSGGFSIKENGQAVKTILGVAWGDV